MTDTPKDRDMDEAVRIVAHELIGADIGYAEQRADASADILAALRSSGYLVARPVADEGLRSEIAQTIATAMGEGLHGNSPGFLRVADAILPLIRAREAALRAERDQAVITPAGRSALDLEGRGDGKEAPR